MSIFSKIGKGIGKFVGGVGDVVSKAAPLASFIPGVGPLAAAGLGAAGGLAGQLNNKKVSLGSALSAAAGGGALGYAGGYGIDKLQGLSAANGGGISGLLKGVAGGHGTATGATPGIVAAPGSAGAARGGIGRALSGIASTLGGQNGAANQLAALGLLGSAGGAYLSGRAEDQTNKFNQDQVTYSRDRNAALDPIRSAALQGLLGKLGVSMPAASAPSASMSVPSGAPTGTVTGSAPTPAPTSVPSPAPTPAGSIARPPMPAPRQKPVTPSWTPEQYQPTDLGGLTAGTVPTLGPINTPAPFSPSAVPDLPTYTPAPAMPMLGEGGDSFGSMDSPFDVVGRTGRRRPSLGSALSAY